MSLLDGARRVVFAHAHPDDETLSTGVLITHLTGLGVECHVLTATRGERGDVVPGPLAALVGTPELVTHRDGELRNALATLGVRGHCFLGSPPARQPGKDSRIYRDSGMRWITPEIAGPAADADAASLTAADPAEAAADLAAYLQAIRPDVVVTYDAHGGYGHPDHVRMHEICRLATDVLLLEVIPPGRPIAHQSGIEWLDLTEELAQVLPALRAHASQFDVEGTEVVHCGGQREPIVTQIGLRQVC